MTRILRSPRNCWSEQPVDSVGLLVDGDDYYRAFYQAAQTAEHTLFLAQPFPLRLGPAPDPSNSWYLGRDGVLSLNRRGNQSPRPTNRGREMLPELDGKGGDICRQVGGARFVAR